MNAETKRWIEKHDNVIRALEDEKQRHFLLRQHFYTALEAIKRLAIEEVCVGGENDCPYCIADEPHPITPATAELIAKLEGR
jgi:hypothetical protein